MFKNWSKIVLVSMIALMLVASVSFASTTRVRSLVNTGNYMSDDSNVHTWYSVLPMYANQVTAEIGTQDTSDSRALSLNYACGDEGNWGTYRISLNENALDDPGLWSTSSFFSMLLPGMASNLGLGFVSTPMSKWDLAGGWELGENASLGVSFTRSSWSFEGSNPDTTADQSYTTVGVGGTWTNNEGFAFDAAFTWGSAGGEASFGATDPYTVEFDSKTAFEVGARAFYDWKDDVTLVPVVSFQSADYSLTDNDDPTTLGAPQTGDKYTNFLFGAGLNMDVNSSNMLIVALEVNSMKWEFSNSPESDDTGDSFAEIKGKYLPTIRMALETAVNSWMTTRIGAAKHLGDYTYTDLDGDEFKFDTGTPGFFTGPFEDSDGFDWSLGLGFNVAEWTIDLEVAEEAPFSTFYWVTGYSNYDQDSDEGPVTRISGIYNF